MSLLKDQEFDIAILEASVVALRLEVAELKQGACRWNCRTARENFEAGYEAAFVDDMTCEGSYNEYRKRRQQSSNPE